MSLRAVAVLVLWPVLLAAPAAARAQAPVLISASGSAADLDTDASRPVLAADRSSGRVLAVWQVRRFTDTSVAFARVLDARGRPLGPQFALPGLGLTTTAFAVAARPGGGWVVVAGVERANRSTRIVSVAVSCHGVPQGARSVSAAAPSAGAGVATPAVAFDRGSGRGLIAWFLDASSGAPRRGGVYVRPVSRGARPAGPAHMVAAAPRGARHIGGGVTLGFSGRARRWLAVWQQDVGYRDGNRRVTTNLYSRGLRADGRGFGARHGLGLAAGRAPLLIPATRASRAVVVFAQESFDGARRLKLVRLDAGGAKIAGSTAVVGTAREPLADTSPQILPDGDGGRATLYYAQPCAPVGHGACPRYVPVLGQKLDRTGAPRGRPVTIAPRAIGGAISVVATGARSALFAWEAAAVEGMPAFDDTAMRTVFPQKGEIAVAPLAR